MQHIHHPDRRSRRLLALAALLLVPALLVACSDDESADTTDGSAPEATEGGFQVAYLPCGKINDQSWSQAGYEGVEEAAEALDAEISVSESLTPAEVEDAMRDYAEQGYDVVLGHCGSFAEAAAAVAEDYPDTWFEAAGLPEAPAANTFAYDPKQEQGSFLAGMLAGFLTETDEVGMVVAYDFPAFNRQSEAFALGARYVNPDVEAVTTFIDTFEDATIAKEAALGQVDGGADVIFVATDQAAVGVFEAASESDTLAIAQYFDQQELAPENIVTSVLYQQGATLTEILEAVESGELEPSSAFTPGLAEGVGELAPYGTFEDTISPEVQECVDAVQAAIVDGSFEVPSVDVLGSQGAASDVDVDALGDVEGCLGAAA